MIEKHDLRGLGPFFQTFSIALVSGSCAGRIANVGAAKNEFGVARGLEDFLFVFYEGGNPGTLA